jgi:pilus assembly protein FimV
MNIRIARHCGPVFPSRDPILGRINFYGSQVNTAARIEPVTAPGSVCISEQTAAQLSTELQFACDYIGDIALAKQYGRSRLFRPRRRLGTE